MMNPSKLAGYRALPGKLVGPAEPRSRTFILGFAAAAMVLIGSFLNFLSFNDYPLVRTEVLVVTGCLVAFALLLALVGATAKWGRVIVPIVVAFLAIDLNSDGPWYLAGGLVVSLLALRFLRQALVLWFGVVLVGAVWSAMAAGPKAAQSTSSTADRQIPGSLPSEPEMAIVHLILDEHIGLEGIPETLARGVQERDRLRQSYVDGGFRIYGGAYSESFHTVNSIPRALELSQPNDWVEGRNNGAIVRSNPYFDRLQSMGFRIDVVQTDWLDYCRHPAVASCRTHPAGRPVDVGDALSVADKATLLINRMAALSVVAQRAVRIYDLAALISRRLGAVDIPIVQPIQTKNTSTVNGMAAFEDALAAARTLTPGQALFAHVLLPHYPYAYDRNCALRPLKDWLGRNSLVSRERRYDAYFDQTHCTTAKVGELVAATYESPAMGNVIFIVHGDHGSRIMNKEPIVENGVAPERDLIDAYSTLFAVSAPAIAPGYDSGRYPLRALLSMLVGSDFRDSTPIMPDDFVHTILIEDRGWNPVHERTLEDSTWWTGSPDGHAH